MAGDQTPKQRRDAASDVQQGWTAVSYLIAGIGFWGFVGWLIDHWLLHTKGIATGIGAIAGSALGVYVIVKKMGA
jgi:F0F1-type ATP synthase assembly protein I